MPKDRSLHKILVIGSGPIVIGQAAEFDYAGTQCCRALKEEDVEVVLLNSNPATIMTDPEIADTVYVEPMEVEIIDKICAREAVDGVIGTQGGQTGLNLLTAADKVGIWKKYGIQILGTSIQAVETAEDRQLFKEKMLSLNQPIPKSFVVESIEEALQLLDQMHLPLVVRPAFTLGGTGGGIAFSDEELKVITEKGLKRSMIHQVLVEEAVLGWKEIEYEVMRDALGNRITICNMENLDPMGIHTGESIVVAPSQTLSDEEYHLLRSASLTIIDALGVVGGCNIQFAFLPEEQRYAVIEVNPRLSRSSALASKATGYPIARVAAKIALGYTLDEIPNAVTQQTKASFEPALDYVVTKIPRWPFDKFAFADRRLGTQMKSTGEIMAIGRTFEESLLKAIRSLEINLPTLVHPDLISSSSMELDSLLRTPTDLRLFAVFEAFRRGWEVAEVAQLTHIDPFFLCKMKGIIHEEKRLREHSLQTLDRETLLFWKRQGFSDAIVARGMRVEETEIQALRQKWKLFPTFKMVDTCAAEFEAATPYFYSTYETENEVSPPQPQGKKRALVIGGGPIRIGQGIEFDYCSVHGVLGLEELGYEALIINNNPETVSTDFDISSALFFEPLSLEDVLHVVKAASPEFVIVQLGGQTAINLAEGLSRSKVKLAGTSFEGIRQAEDRGLFDQLMERVGIERPVGRGVRSKEEALLYAEEIGYPLLVRPSFVLGGRAMEIVYKEEELEHYLDGATQASPDHPVLIDRYILGKEVEVDALCDEAHVFVPAIMEHIERAGVHSGDSMAVCPAQTLTEKEAEIIVRITTELARALKLQGFLNIQFVVRHGKVLVLEVNPRCSRTLPFLSKVTNLPLVRLGVKCMCGEKLSPSFRGLYRGKKRRIGVKAPVFSFAKLEQVDVFLGPEMKSTGEVMGWDERFPHALYKAFLAADFSLPGKGGIIFTLADKDKEEGLRSAAVFAKEGYTIYATEGTTCFFRKHDIQAKRVKKIKEGSPNLLDYLSTKKIVLLVNTLSSDKDSEKEGMKIRRKAVELGIPCITSLDTLQAFMDVRDVALADLQVRPIYE